MNQKPLDLKRFIEIIGDQAGLNPHAITEKAHLADELGIDSIAMLKIIRAVETEIGREFEDLDFDEVVTVGDAFQAIGGL